MLLVVSGQDSVSWVRATLNNVVAIRTWKELNGEDVIPMEEMSDTRGTVPFVTKIRKKVFFLQ